MSSKTNLRKSEIFFSFERMKATDYEKQEMAKRIVLTTKEPAYLHNAYENLENAFYECILTEAKYLTEL